MWYFLLTLWSLLWLVSVTSWFRFAECDLSMMAKITGRFGVGTKSAWTKDGSHIIIYYPIQKSTYEEALKKESNRMPWMIFGDKCKNAWPNFEK